MDIHRTIDAYHGKLVGVTNYRYRSWEHCYQFFQKVGPKGLRSEREHAALHLAFYLASWGMYRGSCFLLQYDYTIHYPVIDLLRSKCQRFWDTEFGSSDNDFNLIPDILATVDAVRAEYNPCKKTASDTLVTKILLGTLGCMPACDRYFILGFKRRGFSYSYLNQKFMERVLQFTLENNAELRDEQKRIQRLGNAHYPLMKLVDMYFWQIGFKSENPKG